jgi:hypothetical protein
MKKQKPIVISRRKVRKSVRKPMPPPAKVYQDRKKAKLEREIEREALDS